MKGTMLIVAFLAITQPAMSFDITWVKANARETEAEACIRVNKNPVNMDSYPLQWNETTFRDVVTNELNMTVAISSSNGYGIEGCCAPGLWCKGDGTCFTQGFGAHFSNFGWLPGDNTSHPVYTCAGTYSAAAATINKAALRNGKLTASGTNIAVLDSTTTAYVYGETCISIETCNCLTCNARLSVPQCPPGFLCPSESGFPYCTQICTEEGDAGCPCDQVCREFAGSDAGLVRICLPPSPQSFATSCATSSDNFMCNAARAYTAEYAELSGSIDSFPVSLMTGSVGAEKDVTPATISTGFCTSDANCVDGDLSTRDSCDTATKLCKFVPVEGVSSVLYSVARRKTAFMYYTYYADDAAIAQTQASSVAYLLANGVDSNNANKDDYPLQPVDLPSSIVFFGNLVKEAFISPNGVVSFPPVRICDKGQCLLFTTSSNLVSPFHADWDPSLSPDSSIKYFTQEPTDPAVFGVTGTALHVLYKDVIRFRAKGQPLDTKNTFAASIYSDGSVRLSYVDITTHSTPSDFSGLWGSFVSSYGDLTESTNLLYHNETVPWAQMNSGSEKLYCPLGATACPVESCVAPRDTLQVRYNGSATCEALGSNFTLSFTCSFAGGVNTSVATYVPVDATISNYSFVTCSVPELGFANSTVIEVAIVISAQRTTGDSGVRYIQNINDNEGSKSVFGVYQGANAELARSSLLVRYFPNRTADTPLCGCNALPSFANLQCDALSVCGGQDNTADCAGTPFGRAMKTECDTCAAGMTGITPRFYCAADSGANNIISETIILLMIICALCFLIVSVTYSVRRMMMLRAMSEEVMLFNQAMLAAENALVRRNHMGAVRGLTPFECDALGEVEFTLAFYEQHKKEQQKLLHPVDDATLNTTLEAEEASTGDVEASIGATPAACECSICLMDIEVGTKCRALPAPCGHIFHVACIDQWFAQSYQCPLCKRSVRAMLLGNDEPAPAENDDIRTELHFVNGSIAVRLIPMRPNPATQTGGAQASPRSNGSSPTAQPPTRFARQQIRRHVDNPGNNLWGAQRSSPTHLRDPAPVPSSRGHTTTRIAPNGAARSNVHYQEMPDDGSADSVESPLD